MTDLHPLAGVYAAAISPLKADASSFDFEAAPALLHFLASRGCHGVLLFGTTGEGPSFSPREREAFMRSVRVVRNQLRGFKLLVGTGTPSLTETIELTKLAFDLNYDGVVVLPPYYFRKATDDGLFQWFSELIEKAVPQGKHLLGYHIPAMTGVGFWTCSKDSKQNSPTNLLASKTHPMMKPSPRQSVSVSEKNCSS